MSITFKTPDEIQKMRVAGRLAAEVLDYITPFVKPGVTTGEIDRLCHDYMVNVQQCIPAPLNYEGYPYSVCTSVNEQVCHGFPSEKVILKEGDIINVDCSTILNGYFSDSSRMFCIGEVSPEKKKLVQVTKAARDMPFNLDELKPLNNMKLKDILT